MAQGPASRNPEVPREPGKPAAAGSAADSPVRTAPANDSGEAESAPADVTGDFDTPPDRMLGEFRILRRLGKGGMAEVFLAEQTSLKRNVAVKVLLEERLADATYLKRFKTEAMAAAALSHPNIVQVYLIGEQDGTHFIAQEYVQGMNLRELVTRKGPPELGVALKVIRQVASALHAAHSAGIVHRDIKPENIMLTRRGDVKVADFGLAQLTQSGEKVNLTQVGVTMGTPLYMSPEQVNGLKLDQRSDLYSFGVTCYHMLTGAPPFRGETALSVAVQHLKQEPERLEQIRGDLPPAICRIVHKMMAKSPDKRYQSAQDVLRDLRRVTMESGEAVAPLSAEVELPIEASPIVEKAGFWKGLGRGIWHLPDQSLPRQLWSMALLALLVGGASAGVGWLAREPNPFDTPPRQETGVPAMESSASQYLYAQKLKTDAAAWQAVIDFSPPAPPFQDYARQQLALLHLVKGRYDEAMALFSELASRRGSSDSQWRAFGLAGEAVVLHLRGEYQQSQRVIETLKPLYGKLDGRMQTLVSEAVERNLKGLNSELDREWQALFDQQGQDSGGHRADE